MHNTSNAHNTAKKRDYTYDWLRLIATLLVVISHSAYLKIQTTYGGVDYALPANLSATYNSAILTFCRYLAKWVNGFQMPLFFMLSGAVFALRPIPSLDELAKKKIKRLLIPYYLVGLVFMLPVKYIGDFYTKENLAQAYKGFLSGTDSGHLWFLTALLWMFIIFAVLEKGLQRFCIHSNCVLLLLCGSILIAMQYIDMPFDLLHLQSALRYLFWFAFGYVFQKARNSVKPWSTKKRIAALIALLVLEIAGKHYDVLDKFFSVVIASGIFYLIADLINQVCGTANESKLVKFLMKNQFYVYLFHDPLEYIVLKAFIGNGWLCSAAGCYLYTFLRIFGVFVVSLLLGAIVSKAKSTSHQIVYEKESLKDYAE